MPLQLHLGHPERAYEIFFTPQPTSAMAMFGFVYLWYLLGILLIEIWFEYRQQLVLMARQARGVMKGVYGALSLFSNDMSPEAVAFDHRASKIITIIGIPSAFLLHGYVGFIFGSVKANPWWGSVLMPIVFLMSAIVSGIAMVMFLYIVLSLAAQREARHALPGQDRPVPARRDHRGLRARGARLHPPALPERGVIKILGELVSAKLFTSLVVMQVLLGMLLPLLILVLVRSRRDSTRSCASCSTSRRALLIQVGIFIMRWNVVIGGQLFSKSFRGLMAYKMEMTGIESLLTALLLLALPFVDPHRALPAAADRGGWTSIHCPRISGVRPKPGDPEEN